LQKWIGAQWINRSTSNLLHVVGDERLPPLRPSESYICVANHRSFFDLYVVSALLVGRGLPHRLVYPVRSNFFYDHPFGFVVNGAMSFFAMYPPVFRDAKRQEANLASIDEVVRLLRRGGAFVGLHPEGTRNKTGDPYALLPAQPGVGRIVHAAKVTVLPVFVNGLTNSIPKQVAGNVTRRGEQVNVVFGAPVDFGRLLEQAPSPRVYRQVAERTMEAIAALAEEERRISRRLSSR
jgi:1-acyl-sn-glycerol-3-phosphate acyltransferase